MQVVHPMQKCPAEFVETFREVLENTNFNNEFRNVFICVRISDDSRNTDTILMKEALQWISTVIDHSITFNCWLAERTGIRNISYTNQCRKLG